MTGWMRRLLHAGPLLLAVMVPSVALAQVSAGGLGTRVNGSALGRCFSGSCAINGGTKTGDTLFHRFGQFDTRGPIRNLRLDTRGLDNIVVGVTNPAGTFLDKLVQLSSSANLFWFSPGGIWLGHGSGVVNVNNFLLSTSSSLRLGDRFVNIFSDSAGDIARLRDATQIGLNQLEHSNDGNLSWLGLNGSDSIVLAGGLITVERHLLLESSRGNVVSRPNAESQLTAGRSIRLIAQDINLNDVRIAAEERRENGGIILQNPTNTESLSRGMVRLEGATLKGRQVLVNAGEISIDESRIQAPRGLIQLSATNPDGRYSSLRLGYSDLDVRVLSPRDWISTFPEEETSKIGLFSAGSIVLDHTTLNTSQEISQILSHSQSNDNDRSALQDRSGDIYLNAKAGIRLNSSNALGDAEDILAGRIILVADGDAPTGGIKVDSSLLSASHGAGAGFIYFVSKGGVEIFNSRVEAISDRYPLVKGQREFLVPDQDGEMKLEPLTFTGGAIYLDNFSSTFPVFIQNSKILAQTFTSGGGINNPNFNFGENNVGLSDRTGYLSGKIQPEIGPNPVFNIGYTLDLSSGSIEILSNGGIVVEDSRIDASSGNGIGDRMSAYENTAGKIMLINLSDGEVSLKDSTLSALSGSREEMGGSTLLAGSIPLLNSGPIQVNNSTLDSTVQRMFGNEADENSADDQSRCQGICLLSLSSVEVGHSELLGSSIIIQDPMKYPMSVFDIPSILAIYKDGFGERGKGFNEYIVSSANAQFGLTSGRESAPQALLNLPSQFLQTQFQSQSSTSVTSIPSTVAVNLGGSDAARLFLEGQGKSLQETTRRLGLPEGMGRVRSIADLQARLQEAGTRGSTTVIPDTNLKPYVPAILHLARQDQASGMSRIDAILLPADGDPISRSVELPTTELKGLIATFQKQLSRREPLDSSKANDAGAKLSRLFLDSLLPSLQSRGITALLLEVDRGLQAVPFGALPIDHGMLGESFALTITPSLGLIELDSSRRILAGDQARLLLAGASKFGDRNITPLPMVRQELETLARENPSTLIVDSTFNPQSLKERANDLSVAQLHIATHAEFLPGQSSSGRLFTPNDALSLADLGRSLRSRPGSRPLDLISLSGCVTALGDEQSELGFVGMSLQAGARSGLGSLWEVDDAATAAFFIQYFRYLKLGLAKDQALQATQSAFRNGDIVLQGDRLVGPGNQPLITGLSREEQTLFSLGLRHPYYWAGMILTGSPW